MLRPRSTSSRENLSPQAPILEQKRKPPIFHAHRKGCAWKVRCLDRSIDLILPVEDGDVSGGDAETVDVSEGEWTLVALGSAVPIPEALPATGEDRGLQVISFDGIDVDRAKVAALLAEDGVGAGGHDLRNETSCRCRRFRA